MEHNWYRAKNRPAFFETFGVDDLKSFIIQDDQKVIEKIICRTEQLTRTEKIITLVNINFSLNVCKNLSKNELDKLSATAYFFICAVFSVQASASVEETVYRTQT